MGLALWLVSGLGTLAVVWALGPRGWFHGRWRRTAVLGLGGAVAGGLLATVLGFGGLLALDPRAALSAALGALVGILVVPALLP
jgi:uncharacterized membrane protein YeaQ/YmgE (transglycosylase-associated protein family)